MWIVISDRLKVGWLNGYSFITSTGALWEGYHESRRCSRDTYPESYITKYTNVRNRNVQSGATYQVGPIKHCGTARVLYRALQHFRMERFAKEISVVVFDHLEPSLDASSSRADVIS